jgi:hypothetical protein
MECCKNSGYMIKYKLPLIDHKTSIVHSTMPDFTLWRSNSNLLFDMLLPIEIKLPGNVREALEQAEGYAASRILQLLEFTRGDTTKELFCYCIGIDGKKLKLAKVRCENSKFEVIEYEHVYQLWNEKSTKTPDGIELLTCLFSLSLEELGYVSQYE